MRIFVFLFLSFAIIPTDGIPQSITTKSQTVWIYDLKRADSKISLRDAPSGVHDCHRVQSARYCPYNYYKPCLKDQVINGAFCKKICIPVPRGSTIVSRRFFVSQVRDMSHREGEPYYDRAVNVPVSLDEPHRWAAWVESSDRVEGNVLQSCAEFRNWREQFGRHGRYEVTYTTR